LTLRCERRIRPSSRTSPRGPISRRSSARRNVFLVMCNLSPRRGRHSVQVAAA
jgi:hypothetical protein